jgi:hypothetical protein
MNGSVKARSGAFSERRMKAIEYSPLVVVHREASTSIDAVHTRLRLIISEKPTCLTVSAGLQAGCAAVCPAATHASMTAGRIDLSATIILLLLSGSWSVSEGGARAPHAYGATHAEFTVSREGLLARAEPLLGLGRCRRGGSGQSAPPVRRAAFAVDSVQARVVMSDVAVRRFARIALRTLALPRRATAQCH